MKNGMISDKNYDHDTFGCATVCIMCNQFDEDGSCAEQSTYKGVLYFNDKYNSELKNFDEESLNCPTIIERSSSENYFNALYEKPVDYRSEEYTKNERYSNKVYADDDSLYGYVFLCDAQFHQECDFPLPVPDPIAGNWNNDKYKDIDKCTDIDVKYIKACGCIPAEVADIVSKIYFILRIIGPVLLLIIGGFEMAKAIIAQDESAIEKAKKKLINKFIAAAAIFLVLTVIKFIVEIVGADSDSIMECVEILLNGYVI